MTELNNKAIQIKGKDYVLVSDRVLYFNENYPDGSISTELISQATDDMVVIKATVLPDSSNPHRVFTGYSQATWGDGYINKTSALENCETSSVGRALGFMGIGVIDSIASVDEINKAQTQKPYVKPTPENPAKGLTMPCQIHKTAMTERVGKNGKPYFAHSNPNGSGLCFGK
jgi:hypothetical protein